MYLLKQFSKFSAVGVINTILSLSIIYGLAFGLHFPYLIANAIGYLIGLINSFILNREWTFQEKNKSINFSHIWRFLLIFIISYSCQAFTLFSLKKLFSIPEAFGQIPAMGMYTIVNFFGNRLFVFNHTDDTLNNNN